MGSLGKVMVKEKRISQESQKQLNELYQNCPLSTDDKLNSLGLFMRSSALTKLLFLNELYLEIKDIPGAIVEFGCWAGQNLAVFENLRAIYEPFNERPIVGFDTFEGHTAVSEYDKESKILEPTSYGLPDMYLDYLGNILAWHQQHNVLGRNTIQIIKGDASKTFGEYRERNKYIKVALAYFDMGLFYPTYDVLSDLQYMLLPGSVLMFDEFSHPDYPGETKAFEEVFLDRDQCTIKQSRYMPNRAIVKMR